MNSAGKHQPCGKPGCINCWPESKGFNGQAQMLSEHELSLRECIIRQSQGQQNIAPGSPLYDKLMGTNMHEPSVAKIADDYHAAPCTPMKTSTQVKLAFCMLGFSIGVFAILITLAVAK